jgi:hypothetical protein
MSYLGDLRAQLALRGIRGSLADRIVTELADHLACDPEAKLGDPALVATRFAEELGVARTRRATYASFGGLAIAALMLAISTRALSPAGGFPDLPGMRGYVVSLAGLAIALGAQVAFVAGVLGVSLAVRRSGATRVAQRRMGVALGACSLVVVGQLVDAFSLRPYLSTWWFLLALAASATSAAALAACAGSVRAASNLTVAERGFRPLPGALLVGVGAAAVGAMCVGSAVVERSWAEGLSRGAIEAAAIGGCYAVLGRRLGLRRRPVV